MLKKIIYIFFFMPSLFTPNLSHAFTCKVVSTGQLVGGGTANVYVNLTPTIGINQNLIVDLSSEINCKNDSTPPEIDIDHVNLVSGTSYGGALNNFTGSVRWNSTLYQIPLMSDTKVYDITDLNYKKLPVLLYLTPVGSASGKVINSGELIAVLNLYKIATFNGGHPKTFTWNIYANNNVIIPTGGCDVSARDVTVTLPDYPGSIPVPLTIHCAKDQKIGYYLSGLTADNGHTIFTNISSTSPSQGIGVQMTRNDSAISTNSTISLGIIGTTPVDLGLKARYARTTGPVMAGNVQSIIGITFIYQ